MKTKLSALKTVKAVLVALSVTGVVFAQAGQGASQKPSPLAPAQQTGPKKANIAVINLKSSSGVTTGEADLISDRLRGDLFNTGKVNVMERDQMQEILKEQGFQQSGACTNEACMVEMGQLLGVEQLVTGSLGKVGSMFLVNLRIIDVKTAKITKVVSKDIKGSIEDVVGELGPIAAELVGASGAAPAPEVVEGKTAEPEQPKPETVAEHAKETAPEPVPDERAQKNKNRFGISFGTKLFFGPMDRVLYSTFTDSNYYVSYDTIDYEHPKSFQTPPKITRTPLINYYFKGVLKAGPFITIDIGGGYSRNETEYEWDYTTGEASKETHVSDVYSFPSLGVNFVKRWYPIKLNVGPFFDLNFLNYSVTMASRLYDFESFTTDTTLSYFSINGDFGVRAGVEILLRKHVGFNVDFVYCYSAFTTLSDTYTKYDYYGYRQWDQEIVFDLRMPAIGLGLGVNFYF